jgi:uncharacterized membrane protein YidH (DUF202 family)
MLLIYKDSGETNSFAVCQLGISKDLKKEIFKSKLCKDTKKGVSEAMQYLLINMTVDYIRVNASNRKQIERLIRKRSESLSIWFVIILAVAVLGLAGLLYLS